MTVIEFDIFRRTMNGEWSMENEEWRMKDGELGMENGELRMENYEFQSFLKY